MRRKILISISICIFLVTILFIFSSSRPNPSENLVVQNGVLTLQHWNPDTTNTLKLNGE